MEVAKISRSFQDKGFLTNEEAARLIEIAAMGELAAAAERSVVMSPDRFLVVRSPAEKVDAEEVCALMNAIAPSQRPMGVFFVEGNDSITTIGDEELHAAGLQRVPA